MPELDGYRVAGSLYLLSAVIGFLFGSLPLIPFALGLALVLMHDQAKLDVLRLVVFAWVGISLVLVLIGGSSDGLWGLVISSFLFGGAIIGLMLSDLTQQQVLVLGAVGVVGLLLPILI